MSKLGHVFRKHCGLEQGIKLNPDFEPGNICRDERCDRNDVHEAHVIETKQKKERAPSGGRELWKRSAPKALDHSIMKATSRYKATHFGEILREVRADYGECEERTVYRRMKRLVERGNLIKVDLGLAFAAYLRPKSKLLSDIGWLAEHMADRLETKYYEKQFA